MPARIPCESAAQEVSAKPSPATTTPGRPASRSWRRVLTALVLVAGCFFLFRGLSGPLGPEPERPAASTSPAAQTSPAAASQPSAPPASRYVTAKIEDVQVGDRTAGRNPLREQVECDASEPEADTWRKLILRMTKATGGQARVELLRPIEWIEEAGVTTGGTFFLDLPEMGAVGDARVEAIELCSTIRPGSGNIVTGTFHHEAAPGARILRMEFSDGSVIQGTTDNHPFWSEDREDFVPAGELERGELVRTTGGIAAVVSVSSRIATPGEMLYNIEVHNEHVYQVAGSGVLVHNACLAPSIKKPPGAGNKVGSYTVTFKSGMKYHGKGPWSRARRSARGLQKEHSDPAVKIDWKPAKNNSHLEAFKAEARRIRADGGVRDKGNYNQRNSPGAQSLPKP